MKEATRQHVANFGLIFVVVLLTYFLTNFILLDLQLKKQRRPFAIVRRLVLRGLCLVVETLKRMIFYLSSVALLSCSFFIEELG